MSTRNCIRACAKLIFCKNMDIRIILKVVLDELYELLRVTSGDSANSTEYKINNFPSEGCVIKLEAALLVMKSLLKVEIASCKPFHPTISNQTVVDIWFLFVNSLVKHSSRTSTLVQHYPISYLNILCTSNQNLKKIERKSQEFLKCCTHIEEVSDIVIYLVGNIRKRLLDHKYEVNNVNSVYCS